jgi:hypothetical protein
MLPALITKTKGIKMFMFIPLIIVLILLFAELTLHTIKGIYKTSAAIIKLIAIPFYLVFKIYHKLFQTTLSKASGNTLGKAS